MPSLAPDGNRCKENRISFSNKERQFIGDLVRTNSRNQLISAFALPLTGLIVAGGVALAGFYLMPNVVDEIKEKLQIGKEAVQNTVKSGSGQQQDGSFATILSTEGSSIGQVIVATGSGIPILGALKGATLHLLRAASASGGWVGIYGNFNKNATRIEDLTEGWLYLNDMAGGSGQTWS